MGLGPIYGGRQWPITDQEKAWCNTAAKQPIPEHVKRHHADQHAATHTQRLTLPGRYDRHGNPLPEQPRREGWP